ncbi:DinB family protein [Dermacoccus sp. Tok2021]|uniref:DinB family protein n=1 Tax=Dermacoccus sp. Tok2021 TaxID=2826873 RepID=UPI001CEDBC73|nr:DinB family protein [Dermacoccus sp. Tok2021]MBZ4496808.1 DinB family protein [Dermacoccus sp. Tok2021]
MAPGDRPRIGAPGRRSRRLGRGRVVPLPDPAPPRLRDRRLAEPGDSGRRGAVPPARPAPRGCGGRWCRPRLLRVYAPPYEEVPAVRSERLAQVREFLASVDDAGLDEERRHPWSPEYPETVRSCFHVILEEEWEHLRYALRDLDALDDVAAQGR